MLEASKKKDARGDLDFRATIWGKQIIFQAYWTKLRRQESQSFRQKDAKATLRKPGDDT